MLIKKMLSAQIFKSDKLTLVEIRAGWSGGSHMMDSIINKIEEEFRQEINVVRIDFELYKELLNQLGVENAPAFLFISKGEICEIIKETISKKHLEKIVHDLVIKHNFIK